MHGFVWASRMHSSAHVVKRRKTWKTQDHPSPGTRYGMYRSPKLVSNPPPVEAYKPEPFTKPGMGANQGHEWIQHPEDKGPPCGDCWLAVNWSFVGSVCCQLDQLAVKCSKLLCPTESLHIVAYFPESRDSKDARTNFADFMSGVAYVCVAYLGRSFIQLFYFLCLSGFWRSPGLQEPG